MKGNTVVDRVIAIMILVVVVASFSQMASSAFQPSLHIAKDSYRIDQNVVMKLGGDLDGVRLTIKTEDDSYRYLGDLDRNIQFVPTSSGEYTVELKNGFNTILDSETFTVKPPIRIKKNWLKQGGFLNITAKVKDPVTGEFKTHNFTEGRYKVEVMPKGHVTSMTFRDLEIRNSSVELRYEDVSPDRPGPKKWIKSYAIDPTNLNFTNATVSSVAKGNELWKCKEYNYATQTCYGTWTKLMDLTPGEEYSFTLTPEDPIFAESTHDADDCYEEGSATFCISTEVSAINADGGNTKNFNKQSDQPYIISFQNESQLIDTVQECTFYVNGFDDESNTWTAEFGNWSTQTFDTGSETATGPNPEATVSFNCTSHFGTFDDETLFDDFAARISNSDGGQPATSYIDYAYVVINFSVQDNEAPTWDNVTTSPASPATYDPTRTYQFNVSWTDNDAIDTVLIEHNFTGTLQNYSITDNTSTAYYYNYTTLGAGTYVWQMYGNDTSGNTNSTSLQTYTVNKSSSSTNLLLNGTDGNVTINNSGTVNITGQFEQGSGNITLLRDGGTLQEGPAPQQRDESFTSPDTYQITAQFDGNENYTSSSEAHYVIVQDTIPPSQIANLNETLTGESWILWNWTNPADSDFNHSEIYVNGNFRINTSNNYYNATSLTADSNHTISVKTVDHDGNVNENEVNDTAETQASADEKAPGIFNVSNTSIADSSVNITWDTDEESDSYIFYGTSSGTYPHNSTSPTFVQQHEIILSELEPSTTYYYIVNSTDAAGNSNASQEYSFTTLTDQTPPTWANETVDPTGPVIYGPNGEYVFNVTWTDNGQLDTVLIEHNFTGTFTNYTVTDSTNNVYNYSYKSLGAGGYAWREYANDSEGNLGTTSQFTYTVNKASGIVNLLLNGSNNNISINEGTSVNITGELINGSGNISLYKEGNKLQTGPSPQTNISEFNAPGNYSIQVQYDGNENYTSTSKTLYALVNDTRKPNVTLVGPGNNTEDPDGDLVFTYQVNDTSSISSCQLIINGTGNKTNSPITKEVNQEFVLNNQEDGDYLWSVNCTDSSNNVGSSVTYNLSVFIQEFFPNLLPISCSDPDGTCSQGNVNESDTNWEEHGTLAKTSFNDVYINYTPASIPAGATIHFANITIEKYQETLEGYLRLEWWNGSQWLEICSQNFQNDQPQVSDPVGCNLTESGNPLPNRTEFNSGIEARARFYYSGGSAGKGYGTEFTQITVKYTEDTTPPSVTLESPPDGSFANIGNITFEYTPSDNNLVSCTLYGDFDSTYGPNETDPSPANGEVNSFTLDLLEGFYTWNVQCKDVANNTNFASQNYTLNITNPDIEVRNEWITFSVNESDAIEGQTISIFSIVRNRGNVNSTDSFDVEFFEGNPDNGGTSINGAQTINFLGSGENTTVNVSWTIPGPGPRSIYVRADTPLLTNGSVDETDESNNEANTIFNVKAYQTSYGNLTGRYTLNDNDNKAVFNFSFNQNSSGNIFVAETGVDIQFSQLYALTRNTTGAFQSEDFQELDSALNMTNYTDNINSTWSKNGVPKETRDFEIFAIDVPNVPIINSTTTPNFVSGIVWDQSDGGQEYNGTQDVVFTTEINQDKPGEYGTYDYEIKYPRRLANLNEDTSDTVTFYYEIK